MLMLDCIFCASALFMRFKKLGITIYKFRLSTYNFLDIETILIFREYKKILLVIFIVIPIPNSLSFVWKSIHYIVEHIEFRFEILINLVLDRLTKLVIELRQELIDWNYNAFFVIFITFTILILTDESKPFAVSINTEIIAKTKFTVFTMHVLFKINVRFLFLVHIGNIFFLYLL